MIPAWRTYGLLILGLAIAPLVTMVWHPQQPVLITGLAIGGFDLIILGLMVIDGQRVASQKVEVGRQVAEKLSIGRDNLVQLTVQAKGAAIVQIRDGFPVALNASVPTVQTSLPNRTTEELTYSIHPTQRGSYTWGSIQVRQLSPWKLAWFGWSIPQMQTVAVYPDLMGLQALSIRLTLQSAGSIRQARRLGIGTEFTELKEYATGDDPRLIDWKATARRSRILIRVLEPEQEQTLIILLDRGRLMTAQIKGLTRFDWGLNATLALALAGLRRGDRVGVAVFDRQIHTWIPPERGNSQLPHLLERLTPIQPVLLEPDYFGAVTSIVNQQTRRALVVMITDLVDAIASVELLAALGRLAPRYLPFCVTLRDPEVDRQAQLQTQKIVDTYARAVALNLIYQRQMAFALLKQRGALVLDAPANQVTDQLVDRYLQIKARSLL
jgi:uncharacterized protein (DUF58 family)